jgi:hypothetical protein
MPYSIFFYHGFAIHGTNDILRPGLARLRPPAPVACGGAVRIGRTQRAAQHTHRDIELAPNHGPFLTVR